DKDKKILYKLAKSKNLWEKRITVISTLYFISKGKLSDTFKISKMLLGDKHDLIHKAVGWMLREAGKQDKIKLVKFLEENRLKMPRIMLRYAIEKFSPSERKRYLAQF
ncbi:MAG: DNA alkylation repair protein, partial [Patescibacteria group bacterium]